MRLTLLILSGLLLCSAGELSAKGAASPTGKVLIWETTHKDLPGKLYLAGTLHAAPASLYPLDSTYDRVLQESSMIGLEIRDEEMATLPAVIGKYAFFPPGKKLSDLYSFLDFQKICSFFMKHNTQYTPGALEQHRPWFLYMNCVQIHLIRFPDFKTEYGLENVILRHAPRKEMFSLESVESQIRTLAQIPDRDSARVLLDSVADMDKAGKDLDRIMLALKSGNMAPLEEMVNEVRLRYPVFYRNLLSGRNRQMAEKMMEILRKRQNVLILVGAAHFAGDQSIQEHLKKYGCQLRQLSASGKKGRISPVSPVKK